MFMISHEKFLSFTIRHAHGVLIREINVVNFRLASRQSCARQLSLQPTRLKFAFLAVFCVFFRLLVGGRIALDIVDG